ncbi:MAG TPA: co-chaperone GroES family protein [Oligoflexia bacterium]|nr:co-chaperone GroES family protein [Oligoflexia bacterium]
MAEKKEPSKEASIPGILSDNESRTAGTAAAAATTKSERWRRKINPLGMRVVIRIRREASRTDTGLYLPEGARQNMHESVLGEVIEVASAVDADSDEEANISGVPEGSLVLIRRDAGVRIPWDDDLRIVETKDVLALVHEIEMS